ncbi:MAG TPA: GNAT family N-acetyltransferase [Candidatus Obscuribacterales bacterium]
MSQLPDAETGIRYESFQTWPELPAGPALRDLHALVFAHPDVTEAELRERLSWQRDPLVQLAWAGQQLVAYKIGHLRKEGHFYSWIGGVDPAFRGRGIASRLMQEQHAWCRARGYASVRTHTKNKWRSMLILNLRHGYDVIGSLTDELGEPKLILEKRLDESAV